MLLCFGCANLKYKDNHSELLILVSVDLNKSYNLYLNSNEWLTNPQCLRVRIDTINSSAVLKFKDNKSFYYNREIFQKDQLFKVNQQIQLKNFIIKRFSIISVEYSTNKLYSVDNCFTSQQQDAIKYHIKKASKDKHDLNYYIDEVIAIDTVTKKNIELNSVALHFKCY